MIKVFKFICFNVIVLCLGIYYVADNYGKEATRQQSEEVLVVATGYAQVLKNSDAMKDLKRKAIEKLLEGASN